VQIKPFGSKIIGTAFKSVGTKEQMEDFPNYADRANKANSRSIFVDQVRHLKKKVKANPIVGGLFVKAINRN
jgi:hypothetical protein